MPKSRAHNDFSGSKLNVMNSPQRTDEIDGICIFRTGGTDQEVIGFNISINQRLVVNTLYTVYLARSENNTMWTIGEAHHLESEHANCLDGELATTHVEKIFKVRAKKVDDEDIV